MDPKNKEKIQNLANRPFRSLPVAEDLPRLLKHIRVLQTLSSSNPNGGKEEAKTLQRKPSAQFEMNKPIVQYEYRLSYSLLDSLYHLLLTFSALLSGPNDSDLIRRTFDRHFRIETNSPSPVKAAQSVSSPSASSVLSVTPKVLTGLEDVEDPKLREALEFLPSAYSGDSSSPSAVFLFKLEKPVANVVLRIGPNGLELKHHKSLDGVNVVPDCTITCACPVLTAIITGAMQAGMAVKGRLMTVDDVSKLMLFGDLFTFDRKTFDSFKTARALQAAKERMQTRSAGEDTVNVGLNLKKYLSDVLGEDSKVVWLLKICNSATISPAIIELKFTLGNKFMTKDVPNTWKFQILFSGDVVTVVTSKTEEELKGTFRYNWALSMKFKPSTTEKMTALTFDSITLEVHDITFAETTAEDKRQEITKLLSKYIVKKLGDQTPFESPKLGANVKSEEYPNGDRYVGTFDSKGRRHGKGIYTTPNGDVYDGGFYEGDREGQGVWTLSDGTRYEGQFQYGWANGHCVKVSPNGELYHGSFEDDEFHGQGFWSSESTSYSGQFSRGKRQGRGVFSSENSSYDGQWEDGLFHGRGLYLLPSQDVYEGEFRAGVFHGQGKLTKVDGEVVEGLFENGKPVENAKVTQDPEVQDKLKEKIGNWKEDNSKRVEARKRLLAQIQQLRIS
eukprot:TRINITY_DN2859_c1_g1_i1.p1 TRINITY_DN2859_c1_g1~~TRINITY_DN2859_c1_g1_i1.p1  ORF type:complete len:673 (+),score=237.55 TRINITY_DN2859_c1_g1_i1:157-2175(+)